MSFGWLRWTGQLERVPAGELATMGETQNREDTEGGEGCSRGGMDEEGHETIREDVRRRGVAVDRVLWEECTNRVILSPVEQIGSMERQRWNYNVKFF